MRKNKFLALILISVVVFACNTGKNNIPAYKNPELSVDERVADLLSRMTLEEKVAQMMCVWQKERKLIFDEKGIFDAQKIKKNLPYGIGQMGSIGNWLIDSNGAGKNAKEMAELTNTIQKYFVENTRLGIPVVFHEECLHGHAAKDATSFPQPIALASSWDDELISSIYTVVAEEARCRGAHQALCPVVDVAREPRWGRFEETFGEDPYLVSCMGVAEVKALQGEGPGIDNKHVIATLKHMVGHGQPESGTNIAPANYSERIIREVFLAPFKACVQQGGVMSVMASYNEIDGIPSHCNKWLLDDVLRKEWGFKGYVVADYFAVKQLISRHRVAKDSLEAAAKAVTAGVDIELPDMECYPKLVELVKAGKIKESLIDKAVARLLKYKFLLGLFEHPYVDPDYAEKFVGSEQHALLAKEAALKSIILLKNKNNILPLDKGKVRSIAVIGPNADRELLGGYSDKPKHFITVFDGIKNKAGDKIKVVYSEGCKITEDGGSWDKDEVVLPKPEEDDKRIAEAVRVARTCDVVVMALGGNEQISREAWSDNHLGDMADIELLGKQNELFKNILALGKPVIVFLFNGKPYSVNYIAENADAIFECWYLGQETGYAVADVLFGDYNPGGKLSATIPRSVGHLPDYYNYKPSARRGYLFGDISPLYPFGFGLSYTEFKFENLKLNVDSVKKDGEAIVSVDVSNIGKVKGDEVVQMYIRDEYSSVTRPVKELKGFKRITLNPGEKQTVSFKITPDKLAFYDINMNYTVEPGDFDIMVGNSSVNLQKVVLKVY